MKINSIILTLTEDQQRAVFRVADEKNTSAEEALTLVLQAGIKALIGSPPEPLASPRRLLERLAQREGITVADLTSKSRTKNIVGARRRVAVELRAAGFSYPEIGRALGMDHTSVMHTVRVATGDERALLKKRTRKIDFTAKGGQAEDSPSSETSGSLGPREAPR